MTKKCSKCGQVKDIADFTRKAASPDGLFAQCKQCKRSRDRVRANTSQGKEVSWRANWKYRYERLSGVNSTIYLEKFRIQNGKCAICGVSHLELNQKLSTDHNHTTGKIRGLLCSYCNLLLSYTKDNPIILDNARQYLEYHANKNKKQSELKTIG